MRLNRKTVTAVTAALLLLTGGTAHASSLDTAVVDVALPAGAVSVQAGDSVPIVIKMTVTGKQDGTATFKVHSHWVLSGGVFTGSDPLAFTVPARTAQDPATAFAAAGTVAVASGQAGGTFTLAAAAFDITNSNPTGAKLGSGSASGYAVTVTVPATPPPANSAPSAPGAPVADANPSQGAFTLTWAASADAQSDAVSYSLQARSAADADYAVVASGLTTPAYSFAAGQPGEGTWRYRVKATETATSPALSSAYSADSVAVVVDRTGPNQPTAVADRAPEHVDARGSWWKDAVTVGFEGAGDPALADGSAGSGLAGVDDAETFDDEGPFGASGVAWDRAGNVSVPGVLGGNVDTESPEVAVTCPSDVYFGQGGTATWTAADSGSGLAGAAEGTIALDTTSLGLKSASVAVSDNVGHVRDGSCDYTVQAWTLSGFYQPVDMGDVVNTVKNGATVPLKFAVSAGPTALTSTAAVKSFVQTRIACDTSATVDAVELTVTGGTSLRYDATAGQFIQNWQTPKIAGACYRVAMTTQDGSTLTAKFRLR